MNNFHKDSEEDLRAKNEDERPATTAGTLDHTDRLHESARPAARKHPGLLNFSRVREPGVRPKGFFVWLGRLRRKRG